MIAVLRCMPLTLVRAPAQRTDTTRGGVRLNAPPIAETDLDRVLKLIPTEVVTAFTAAITLGADVSWKYFDLAVTAAGVLLVVLVLERDGRVTGMHPRLSQFAIRTLAFLAWALLVSEPLTPWFASDDVRRAAAIAVVAIPLLGFLALRDKPVTEPIG
jgi:hypothetical protein